MERHNSGHQAWKASVRTVTTPLQLQIVCSTLSRRALCAHLWWERCRHYPSPSLVNYGAFPQTWEDGEHRNEALDLVGDNDPLDAVDISKVPCASGDVYAVKVLGILALIDGDEMDWKVVTIAVDDPLAASLNGAHAAQWISPRSVMRDAFAWGAPRFGDIGVRRVCIDVDDIIAEGGALAQLLVDFREWLRNYKLPDGLPPNRFGYDDNYLSQVRSGPCGRVRLPDCVVVQFVRFIDVVGWRAARRLTK